MTLEEAMEEIFGHGFVFTLHPKKALEALKVIRKTLLDYKQLKADYADLDNRLRTANTEIDRLKSVSSWIPCRERLPDKDGEYLCISNGEFKILPYRNGEFYCTCFDAVLRCCNSGVTHWMPLPEIQQRKEDKNNDTITD